MNDLTIHQVQGMLCAVCDTFFLSKDRLTEIDSAIGDGDHGIGMYNGMYAAKQRLTEQNQPSSINTLLRTVGEAMLLSMGGASGAIFSAMFLGASSGEPIERLTAEHFTAMMRNGLAAVRKRGGACIGDKTMVDALEPAVTAMECSGSKDLTVLMSEAAKASEQGALATKDMVAKFGRAQYLGSRSLGFQDPGAVSVSIMFNAMYRYLAAADE